MAASDHLSDLQFKDTHPMVPLDPYYNEVPEMRGTRRVKGTFNGPTGRELSDQEKLGSSSKAAHPYNPGCLACTRGTHA